MRIKRISFLLPAAGLVSVLAANAQLYNTGKLFVNSNTVLYAKDTFQNNVAGQIVNNGTIHASGTLINNASINGSGKVSLVGTTSQNVAGTGAINNLEVKTAGATILPGNMQNITGTLMLTTGTLTANNGLTLKSTATNTARVTPVAAGSVAGDVIVERYMPSQRVWRLITSPLKNTNTIREAWQNGGVYAPGKGTFVTGSGGSNGLDNGNYSLNTYDIASQQFVDVKSTNVSLSGTTGSAANKGYFIFVRGDRNPSNLRPPNTNITTLSSKGALQTGNQKFTVSAAKGGYTLIGNPYASPVDFNKLTRNNVAKRFYIWDPSLNQAGGYVLVDDEDEDGNYSMTPASTQTNILQSSQAFMVQTTKKTSAASVIFLETSKSDIATNPAFTTNNGSSEVLRTNLYLNNAGIRILADGALSEFNDNFSNAVDIEDGTKMDNVNEALSLKRDKKLLALERRRLISANDTVFLKLLGTTSRNYSFEFVPTNIGQVISAWLEDSYLHTSTPVSVTAPTFIDFSIAAKTASADENRFKIVFRRSDSVISNITAAKAAAKSTTIKSEAEMPNNNGSIVVYPNPVKTGKLNIQLNDQPKGRYFIQIYNNLGQQLFTKIIEHSGGSTSQALQLPQLIPKGIYQLKITSGVTSKTEQILIE